MTKKKNSTPTTSTSWIRTKDRLPVDYPYNSVLFYDAANHWFDIGVYRDGHFLARHYMVPAAYVTHWQPLNQPADLRADEQEFGFKCGDYVAIRYARLESENFRPFELFRQPGGQS